MYNIENQYNTPPHTHSRHISPSSGFVDSNTLQKPRQSNIELLRIVAMFLVLVVHADFWSNGIPTNEECINNVLPSVTRFFFESISIVCVDVFVLISGWFGIRPNLKRMSSFIFQCLFFLCCLYLISLIVGWGKLTPSGILGCFALLHWNWFIKAYIGLCIFAPFLNSYIEHSSEKGLRMTLVWFYIFQTIYGWLFPAAQFIESGYSVFSFVGLYLLAQYVRKYLLNRLFTVSGITFFRIYFVIVLFNTVWGYLSVLKGIPFFGCIFNYTSPLVILASISLLLAFQKFKIQSGIINWVAASSFAVFLLHVSPSTNITLFKASCQWIYSQYDNILCVGFLFVFLLFVFVLAILLDQIRIGIWRIISKWLFVKPNKIYRWYLQKLSV